MFLFTYISGLIALSLLVALVIVSLITIEMILHTIFGEDKSNKPSTIAQNTTTGVSFAATFSVTVVLRGPGDRPLKHADYLSINITARQSSIPFQPALTPFDSIKYQTNVQGHMQPSGCLLSHKFDGVDAEHDNFAHTTSYKGTACKHIPALFETGPNMYNHPIQDKDDPFGVSPLDELTSKTGISGSRSTEYPVLIGNTVVVCNIKTFASLPQHCKYMVKVKVKDTPGAYKVKMTLKSSDTDQYVILYCYNSYIHM